MSTRLRLGRYVAHGFMLNWFTKKAIIRNTNVHRWSVTKWVEQKP